MLEPYEGKLSRTVLRGERSSNTPDLPAQIIENKQRFISQIMTSKTPVRSAEDVDEATLSYAEIKAIATGNPLIKEKMDIDVKLERLKMAKVEFMYAHEQLEHKIRHSYPKSIEEKQALLGKIREDVETIKQNTVLGEDGQPKFLMTLNGKTFSEKKDATKFISEMLKKNSGLPNPLRGLSGEYHGLHIATEYESPHLHEQLVLSGMTTLRKNTSAVAGDNINRIMELATERTKYAEDTQREIEGLSEKIKMGEKELNEPFPQEAEFEKLLLRSLELSRLLNDDADSSEKDRANLNREKRRRLQAIFDGEAESLCEKNFFSFVKKELCSSEKEWTEALDMEATMFLLDKGFSKEKVSKTLIKCSPTVPSKEDVENMLAESTSRAASSR